MHDSGNGRDPGAAEEETGLVSAPVDASGLVFAETDNDNLIEIGT